MFNYKQKHRRSKQMKVDELKTIGIAETARRLNVTLKYVYDLVYSGKLPAQKTGRTWRISASAVNLRLKQRSA